MSPPPPPPPAPAPAGLATVREFSERVLGKGVVIAKDVPGFVANRLGGHGLVDAIRPLEQNGLSLDEGRSEERRGGEEGRARGAP